MHYRTLLALAGLALAPLSAHALPLNDDFSLQIDLAALSDFRSRGISMTLGDPAAQAGATLLHGSGLYAGAWTSNVDFGFDFKTRQEIDLYAGYYWQISDAVSLDLGYTTYSYPKESQFNQSELYALLDAYGIQLGAYYSNDTPSLFGEDQDTLYSYVGYQTRLPAKLDLTLRYGRMDYKDPLIWSRNGASSESYNEWEAKLSRDLLGVTWGLSYVDSDLSQSECSSLYGFTDICSATLVASLSKTF